MIEIITEGETLDLPSSFSVEIEETSPIFDDRGSQSIPATVPPTKRNMRLLNFAHRLDAGVHPNMPERDVEVASGAYIRRGKLNITEASKKEGITFNIGFDNATAYMAWSQRKLSELDNLPIYKPRLYGEDVNPVSKLLEELYGIYQGCDPQKIPFAIYPIAISKEECDDQTYWEMLNLIGNEGLKNPEIITRVLDGTVTEVSIPHGYGVTPFLRVWRVLEVIFENLGLVMDENPFKENIELSRLTVLNNSADCVCIGELRYAELMPDCTVEEFLNALWVRFGLVYNIDYSSGRVSLRLLKDILADPDVNDLTSYLSDNEKIIYNEPQYLHLSAATSLEGAQPACERFEDFSKGLNIDEICMGANIESWSNIGTASDPAWDGNSRDYFDTDPWDDYDPERDFPDPNDYDPWEDRWDDDRNDRDDWDDYNDSRAASRAVPDISYTSLSKSSTLAREYVTGKWYRLDSSNNKVRSVSSGFFDWDPAPSNLEPIDLTSIDECVPIGTADYGLGSAWHFSGKCPLFLVGSRHFHSYIVNSDNAEAQNETPLSFMFAYTTGGKTIGRLNAEGEDGRPIKLDDGTTPTLSLLFQFKDGLFYNFWRCYDEILRHGNRTIEAPLTIDKLNLGHYLNPLQVTTVNNIRCLMESANYTLPGNRNMSVSIKLRTIQTQGNYDISKEQNVAEFSAGNKHLEWREVGNNLGPGLDTQAARAQAAELFLNSSGYVSHREGDEYWCVDSRSAVYKSATEVTSWEKDPSLRLPSNLSQKMVLNYKSNLYYDIYEVHDMSVQGGKSDYELLNVIGTSVVTMQYTVVLVPRWVVD